jgi:hypothetical protein
MQSQISEASSYILWDRTILGEADKTYEKENQWSLRQG